MRARRLLLAALIAALAAQLALAAAASSRFFSSPSGNIGCFISKQGARCDIRKRDWNPPPRPPSCELDFGQGLVIGERGRGRFVCAGDTVLNPEAPPLPYGESIERGHYRCRSKQTGVRCVNEPTGHGFKLSRQNAKRF